MKNSRINRRKQKNIYHEDERKGIYYVYTQLTKRQVLTNQFGAELYTPHPKELIIDNIPELKELLRQYKITHDNWRGYFRIRINGKLERVHRVIYEWKHGKLKEGFVVDHLDSTKNNAKLENLVALTEEQHNTKVKCIDTLVYPYGIGICSKEGYFYLTLIDMSSYEINKKVYLKYDNLEAMFHDLAIFKNNKDRTKAIIEVMDTKRYTNIAIEKLDEKRYNHTMNLDRLSEMFTGLKSKFKVLVNTAIFD
jgi:hypothetical protein